MREQGAWRAADAELPTRIAATKNQLEHAHAICTSIFTFPAH